MTTSRLTRAALATAGVLAASAALAVPAHASLVVPTECPTPEISQPFAAWGDTHDYKLVSHFDDATGWKLNGSARLDAGKLILPAGSSAVSAPVCVGHDEPTLRFFGGGTGTLTVSVQFQLFTGTWLTLPNGVDSGSAFKPSPVFNVIANYLPAPGQYTNVRFVFTPLVGEWQIDDVYVDPRMRI